jgi:hypothetical protein
VICKKGLVGTRGVHVNLANWGCVRKMSLMRVFLSITKSPSSVKCKRPQRVAVRPSRKSYATKGTRAPSKYSSQVGGKREKTSFSESIKEDSI